MFPQCYLSYMDHFQRAIPVMPGSYPSSVPGTFPMPMPGPGMFPGTMEEGTPQMGDHTMGGGTMQNARNYTRRSCDNYANNTSPFETAPGSPTVLDTRLHTRILKNTDRKDDESNFLTWYKYSTRP